LLLIDRSSVSDHCEQSAVNEKRSGGQSFGRLAFVSRDGMFGKAFGQGLRVTPILSGDIDSDRDWKVGRNMGFSY
jgi:hypothetical protein